MKYTAGSDRGQSHQNPESTQRLWSGFGGGGYYIFLIAFFFCNHKDDKGALCVVVCPFVLSPLIREEAVILGAMRGECVLAYSGD